MSSVDRRAGVVSPDGACHLSLTEHLRAVPAWFRPCVSRQRIPAFMEKVESSAQDSFSGLFESIYGGPVLFSASFFRFWNHWYASFCLKVRICNENNWPPYKSWVNDPVSIMRSDTIIINVCSTVNWLQYCLCMLLIPPQYKCTNACNENNHQQHLVLNYKW